jgi:molecular chaperone GrpE
MKASFERAAFDTVAKMLPMIDDFGRALENIPDELKDNAWVSGTALILKKFDKLLEDYHIDVVDPVGEPFDPRMHEAIGTDDSSDYESGIVTTTLQKGYVSGEHVLRPALVRVAS